MAKIKGFQLSKDLYQVLGAFIAVMAAGFILDFVVFVVFEFCALVVAAYLLARPGDKKAYLRTHLLYITLWGVLLMLAKGYVVYQTMNATGRIGGVTISRHIAYALAASANDKIFWVLGLLPIIVIMDVGKSWMQHSKDADTDSSLRQIGQRETRNKF